MKPGKTTTTCITALKTADGSVLMAGDSAGVSVQSLAIVTRSDRKVFLKHDTMGNEFGVGFCGSYRMGQLIQYNLTIPPIPIDTDLHEYMVLTFIPALRTCLKEGGFTTIENNTETSDVFLISVKGRIFYIDSDFQVGENADPYSACGCGEDLALGAFSATETLGLEPEKRVTLAMEAASKFSAGVRPPFHMILVKG